MVTRARVRSRWQRLCRSRSRGYNLVILVMLVAVMNILVAVALPLWSHVMQREREEELIFRGLQYAEAIRRFQQLHNRLPTRLDELLEVEPRSIRQLWTDPFRDDGQWGVILAGTTRGRQLGAAPGGDRERRNDQGNRRNEPVPEPVQDVSEHRRDAGRLSRQGPQAAGPIQGVRPVTEREAARTFMGSNNTSDWNFTADIIPVVPTGLVADVVPRLNSRTIGRPFPEGVEPGVAAGPQPQAQDEEQPQERPRRERRDRRRRSRNRS